MEYMTVREAARKWKVSERLVQQYCTDGRIRGAGKFGGAWAIPVGAEKPMDPRRCGSRPAPKAVQPPPAAAPSADLTLMPLLNAAFVPGHCVEYVKGIEDHRLRDIALAEYYYFSGRPEEAAREAGVYLSHPDLSLRLSACLIYAYANLSIGQIQRSQRALAEVRETRLKELLSKANASGLPEDAQAAKDLDNQCNRFEKKIHDLELTRMISIQTAPQIRLVQNNDTQMVEKIQSTIVNTIPLWKSQMVLALGVEHSAQAAAAQREVTDMTNELLRKNAEKLKMATVETAKESERGIVDMETLKATNESLISTLDEVMQIQQEGRQKRAEAEQGLREMEQELRAKLLEIRG